MVIRDMNRKIMRLLNERTSGERSRINYCKIKETKTRSNQISGVINHIKDHVLEILVVNFYEIYLDFSRRFYMSV